MISMYAIPNCDTVKKARVFLEARNIAYEFVDFKKIPPTEAQIASWSGFGGELPVNKKGTSYRKHKEAYEALDQSGKINFVIANPSMIKRPILVKNGQTIAMGFNEAEYHSLLMK